MMIKVVIPISGGKDSQACLKLACETYEKNQILGLFCDTQFEHPLTYKHIDKMSSLYDIEIKRISEGSVPELVMKFKRFPGSVQRFCTDRLKIKPSRNFYIDLATKQGQGFEVWLGIRTEESKQRAKRYKDRINNELYMGNELIKDFPQYLSTRLGVYFKLPVLDFTTEEIFEYLNGEENPLYRDRFDRVGCFPCLASSYSKQKQCFNYDDFGKQQRELILNLRQKIGTSKKYQIDMFDNNTQKENLDGAGCGFCAI